jgi:hypothetical protein
MANVIAEAHDAGQMELIPLVDIADAPYRPVRSFPRATPSFGSARDDGAG